MVIILFFYPILFLVHLFIFSSYRSSQFIYQMSSGIACLVGLFRNYEKFGFFFSKKMFGSQFGHSSMLLISGQKYPQGEPGTELILEIQEPDSTDLYERDPHKDKDQISLEFSAMKAMLSSLLEQQLILSSSYIFLITKLVCYAEGVGQKYYYARLAQKIVWRMDKRNITVTTLNQYRKKFSVYQQIILIYQNMLVLPWYIRFAIDTAIIATPFIYLHHHPTTHFFEYFEEKRRIGRRRSLETQNRLWGEKQNPYFTKEQAEKFYAELGIKYE